MGSIVIYSYFTYSHNFVMDVTQQGLFKVIQSFKFKHLLGESATLSLYQSRVFSSLTLNMSDFGCL